MQPDIVTVYSGDGKHIIETFEDDGTEPLVRWGENEPNPASALRDELKSVIKRCTRNKPQVDR